MELSSKRNFSISQVSAFRNKIMILFCKGLTMLVLLSVSSINSLSAQNSKAINIDVVKAIGGEKIDYLSNYAKDIQYIPLETKKESLIKTIIRIIVEKNKIFILSDNKSILVFDIKGNFIGKVDRFGRGPQEHTGIISFLVDPVSENICILSSQGVFEYDIKGNFIYKIEKIPEATTLNTFFKIKDGVFLVNWSKHIDVEGMTSMLSTNSILYKDGKHQNLHTYSQKATNVSKPGSPLMLVFQGYQYSFYKYGESIRAERANNDTIITIDSKYKITPEYIFNFGKYGYKSGDDKYEKMILEDDKIISRSSPIESTNYLFLNFYFRGLAPEPFETSTTLLGPGNKTHILKHTDVKAIYDKKNKELRLLKRPYKEKSGLVENIQYGPEFWPKSINSKNELISFMSASYLMNYCSEKKGDKTKVDAIASKLSEEDNPVVVIAIPK
ncbi:MAG: hypothetical protein CVU13_09885 [Bacteroidetes bacterium HGW-Bacteroidetes-8]|jgi:hypothetical protein|nr:MAG: hypothetical protein CVU13_09885 [Bacteroidetes bacterium HGW-Bacteroidetes-8]